MAYECTPTCDACVFSVIKRDGQDDFLAFPIGAAFAHQSGDGFNVILQALPIPDGGRPCARSFCARPKDPRRAAGTAAREPKDTARNTRDRRRGSANSH